MLQWAESQNQIPREIGGSQNGHQAIDCAINRVLTLDAFWQKWISQWMLTPAMIIWPTP